MQLSLFPVDKPRGGTRSLGTIPAVGSLGVGEFEQTAFFPGTWRTPYDKRILMMQPCCSRLLLVAPVRSPDMKPKRKAVSAKKGKLYHVGSRVLETGRFTRVLTSRLSRAPLLPRSVISEVLGDETDELKRRRLLRTASGSRQKTREPFVMTGALDSDPKILLQTSHLEPPPP